MYRLDKNEFNNNHLNQNYNVFSKYMDDDAVRIMKTTILRHWCSSDTYSTQWCALFYGAEDALNNILGYHRLKADRLVVFNFCWDYYKQLGTRHQYNVVEVDSETNAPYCLSAMDLSAKLNEKSIVLLGLPNNPTGDCIDLSILDTIVEQHPYCHFIFDCTYLDPCDFKHVFNQSHRHKNVTLVGSYSKFYGLPGLRFGFALNNHYMVNIDKYLGFNHDTFDIIYRVMNNYEHYSQNRKEIVLFIESLKDYKNITIIKNRQPFIFARLDKYVNISSLIDHIEKNTMCVLKYIVKNNTTYVRISISSDPIIKKKSLEVLNTIDTHLEKNI